jgi:asparaginyl-tRNA synthetase
MKATGSFNGTIVSKASSSHLKERGGSWRDPGRHLTRLMEDPWYRSVLRLTDCIIASSVAFWRARDFAALAVPVTTGSISSPMGKGSDSKPVRATIFGRDLYLADSSQFLLELGTRMFPTGVYYTSCSFRGEGTDARHLSEFTHIEAEMPGGLDDVIQVVDDFVRHLTTEVRSNCANELRQVLDGSLGHIDDFLGLDAVPRITHDDARRELAKVPTAFNEVLPGHYAITPVGEEFLTERFGGAVWLTHLPASLSPFYQRATADGQHCFAADLLLGGREVVGSGERCPDEVTLTKSLRDHDVSPEAYTWYVEMKRLRPMQTSGFGLGLERLLMWLMRADDIRDCTLWLRETGSVKGP